MAGSGQKKAKQSMNSRNKFHQITCNNYFRGLVLWMVHLLQTPTTKKQIHKYLSLGAADGALTSSAHNIFINFPSYGDILWAPYATHYA